MHHLYAPWRSHYFSEVNKDECVFCHISQQLQLDESHNVLFRDDVCFIVMNRYPYTPGHFMIIPHRHIQTLEELPSNEWLRMAHYTQQGVKLLKEGFGAHGVNIGMNLGESAGAGIAEHIHLHLVPRFSRDTNFMTTIADTRVFGTSFEEITEKMKILAKSYFVNC